MFSCFRSDEFSLYLMADGKQPFYINFILEEVQIGLLLLTFSTELFMCSGKFGNVGGEKSNKENT